MTIWKQWRSPSDAIAWATSELPSHCPNWIQQQWELLEPDENGKKAHLWVRWVQDLKVNEFAGIPELKPVDYARKQVQSSFVEGVAMKLRRRRK